MQPGPLKALADVPRGGRPAEISDNAPPSNEDIARVIVASLTDPDRHQGKSYRPTGPELLTPRQMAEILSRVFHRKVKCVEVPLFMFYKAARQVGMTPFELIGIRYYVQDHRVGTFEYGAPTDHVFQTTWRQPEDFETIARRCAAWPQAKQIFGRTVVELLKFAGAIVTPAYDLEKSDRLQHHPVCANPCFAVQSERWRKEHPQAPGVGSPQGRAPV